jgi:methionyl-tRNA formyltransferase
LTRVVFWGTPAFAVPTLRALASEFEVATVYTGPDRPRGRGRRVSSTDVANAGRELGLHVRQVVRLRDPALVREVSSLDADVGVVIAFRVLPEPLFAAPRLGTVNAHPSLLPRYRGASPIRAALLSGETKTGVTTFKLTDDVDAGGVLLQREIDIAPDDDYGSLHDRLAQVSAGLMVETVTGLAEGTLEVSTQDDSLVSYAPRIGPDDLRIDWGQTAEQVVNRIRAFSPTPGAVTDASGTRVKLLRAVVADGSGEAGTVLEADGKTGLVVAAGDGAVRLMLVQPAGRRAMSGVEYVRGNRTKPGDRFSTT